MPTITPEQQKLVEKAVAKMNLHDWFYAYSDDGSVFRRGEASERDMKAAVRVLPQRIVDVIWVKYAPKEYQQQKPMTKADW